MRMPDLLQRQKNSHHSVAESDLIMCDVYYSEWGRKIGALPQFPTIAANPAEDINQLKNKFPGLHSRVRSMIGISSPSGHGVHECLVNQWTGKIFGIRYNNRAEKVEILKSIIVITGIADIIADYAWPIRPPSDGGFACDPNKYQPNCFPRISRIE